MQTETQNIRWSNDSKTLLHSILIDKLILRQQIKIQQYCVSYNILRFWEDQPGSDMRRNCTINQQQHHH